MLTVHVVSHTHWDREWYHPAERFRQGLVELIDGLLDDPQPGTSFLLDGQTVVLEDYLDVRPERASELAKALRERAVEAGPWFVLPDTLIPSGEGLVRNLLAGARTLRALRAESPPVLYCPDSFGHPAALPLIASEFGKPLIILWRGFGGARAPDGYGFKWKAPNGAAALLYHLSRSGYALGANLPADSQEARVRWSEIRAELAEQPNVGVELLLNGADHHARQRNFGAAFKALKEEAESDEITLSSLSQFATDFVNRASGMKLVDVEGELRDSYGYTWSLQGTLASRTRQKRRYAQMERALLRDVEPWVALEKFQGGNEPGASRALVHAAWRSLLLCQPHDTLCGCSVDQVARAMDARLDAVAAQADGLREHALFNLIGHDAEAARIQPADWKPSLLIRNRVPRVRSGVAIVELTTKLADVPVGPGSAHVDLVKPLRALPQMRWPVGEPVQILDIALGTERIESPRAYPDNDAVVRFKAAVWANDVPAYGLAGLPFGESHPHVKVPNQVTRSGRQMSNGKLTLKWDRAGRLSLEQAVSSSPIEPGPGASPRGARPRTSRPQPRTARNLIDLECHRDIGDLYTPAIRQRKFVARYEGTRVLHNGPVRGVVEQRWSFKKRNERIEVATRFILDADADFIRIEVKGENAARDHRLRLRVRTDVRDGVTVADAAFGSVERVAVIVSPDEARMEKPVTTAPLHRYVSQFDDTKGATLFADGSTEYEAVKDGFAVTLVRAVGELSQSDLVERPGHAGWPAATPEAQEQGPFEAAFALMFHGARSPATTGEIERASGDALLPLTGTTLRSALKVPGLTHGVALDGAGLALSSVKESDDGKWLVLRCVNLTDEQRSGSWRLGRAVKEARLARLDETPGEALAVHEHMIPFSVAARSIATILAQ